MEKPKVKVGMEQFKINVSQNCIHVDESLNSHGILT